MTPALQMVMSQPAQLVGRLKIKDDQALYSPFNQPYDEQKELFRSYINPLIRLIVVHKSRQIGVSTENCAMIFQRLYTARNPLTALFAADVDETTEVLSEKLHTFHDTLPAALRRPKLYDNRGEMSFADTGAGWRALTARGLGQGKGFTYPILVCEEFAYWHTPDETLGSLQATQHIGPHQLTVMISTSNGPGGSWPRRVYAARTAAQKGDPRVAFHFWPWFKHRTYRLEPAPGWEPSQADYELARRWNLEWDQVYWRHEKIFGANGCGVDVFPIHFPATIEESFRAGRRMWYDVEYLEALFAELAQRPTRPTGELRIYRRPERDRFYVAGLDPAWCEGGDDAALVIMDEQQRVCAVLNRNEGGLDNFLLDAGELITTYRNGRRTARTIYESNKSGGGEVVGKYLRQIGADLWTHTGDTKDPRAGKPWHTDETSKTEGYTHARKMVDAGAQDLADEPLVEQLLRIHRTKDGGIEGDGMNDDIAMAHMLATWAIRDIPDLRPEPPGHRPDPHGNRPPPSPFQALKGRRK